MKHFCKIEEKNYKSCLYEAYLQELLNLAPILNRFFDKVLVNAPDTNFKNNRKHLIARIYKAFLKLQILKKSAFKMTFDLTALQREIEQKKQSYPEEWLGRSLAYTPYQPRPISTLLQKTSTFTPKNLYQLADSKDFLEIAIYKAEHHSALLLDSLENLTYIRRYVNVPLIFNALIIDTYQILESLVYGADSIVLRVGILSQKTLKILHDFSTKLGLETIFLIHSKEDLTKAIFAGANILILDDIELIPLIPNNKILLGYKTCIHQGIDSFIIND